MPAVIRQGQDPSAGACGCPPVPAAMGSPDVFTNKKPTVRQGDVYGVHSGALPPHAGTAMSGANQVFVNGKLIHRASDPISCGDLGANGSPDVFAG